MLKHAAHPSSAEQAPNSLLQTPKGSLDGAVPRVVTGEEAGVSMGSTVTGLPACARHGMAGESRTKWIGRKQEAVWAKWGAGKLARAQRAPMCRWCTLNPSENHEGGQPKKQPRTLIHVLSGGHDQNIKDPRGSPTGGAPCLAG